MRIHWQVRSPAQIDWGKGFVAFDRTTDQTSLSFKLNKRVVMELRSSHDPYLSTGAILRNPQDAVVGGHFAADLADVTAMARGSQSLYLLSRDRSERTMETVEIESSSFIVPIDKFEERLAEMNRDTRPLYQRCSDLSEIAI